MLARLLIVFVLSAVVQTSAVLAYAADKPVAPVEQRIPYKHTDESGPGISALRIGLALGLVLALGAGAIFAIRRYFPGSYGAAPASAARRVNLLEVRRLSPKLTLYYLEIDGQKLVLGQTNEAITFQHLPGVEKDGSDAS